MSEPSLGIMILEINEPTGETAACEFYLKELVEGEGAKLGTVYTLREYHHKEYTRLYDVHVLSTLTE